MNTADTLTLAAWRTDRAQFAPVANTTEIRTLDGRHRVFWTHGISGADRWDWIRDRVSCELECSPDQVGCAETPDGEIITVDGLPVFSLIC